MRLIEKITGLVIVLILVITIAIVALSAESVVGFVTIMALITLAGATQFVGHKFFAKVTKLSGEAIFEDTPPDQFDADAVFERAMQKRRERSSQDE